MKNKKIIIVIIVFLLLIIGLGLVIVLNSKEKNNDIVINNKKTTNNIAIVYFSATGTTKEVASIIKDITNGDLIEIIPEEKYTSKDLNYGNDDSRATKEQNDSSSRPDIKNEINVDDYDVIYLGYPIWWGDAPHIILTFLDTYNLDGKTVIPFCTSGSSSIDNSMSTLKNYNTNINWIDGKRLTNSKSEIEKFINNINY